MSDEITNANKDMAPLPEQATREAVALLQRHGAMTPEEAQAHLAGKGLSTEADTRNNTEKNFDRVFGPSNQPIKFDVRGEADPQIAQAKLGDYNEFASSLQLHPAIAKAMIEDQRAAMKQAESSPDRHAFWGGQQVEKFAKYVGKDGEQRLAAAAETIRKMTGKQIDFTTAARNNGAAFATHLLLHAERMAKRSAR